VRPEPNAAWWRVALIAGSALTVAVGSLGLFWILARPLALLFAAVVLAAGLAPIAERLERRLPRVLAVTLTYLGLVVVLAAAAWFVVPTLVAQARDLVVNLPALVAEARSLIDRWDPTASDRVTGVVQERLERVAVTLMDLPLQLVSSALEIVLVFILSIYWLISGPALRRFVLSLAPPGRRRRIATVLGEVSEALGGFVRGEVLSAAIVAAIVFLGLTLIGVEYPMVLALLAGLSELVPIVGAFLGGIPAIGVALLDSPTEALVVFVLYVVVQQFESNILIPHVMRRQAGVPPALAIFALVVGAGLGGILGALIAIPFAGMLKVLALEVAAPAIREWTGAPPPDGDDVETREAIGHPAPGRPDGRAAPS